jgi:hypothetical protein
MPFPLLLALGGAQMASGLIGGRKAKKDARKARRAEEARVAEISKTYLDLAGKYKPGGEYGSSMFESLAKRKQLDVGSLAQQYLRAGIGGTSFADTSAQYERTEGRSQRRTLEDFLQDKYTGLMTQRASFLAGAPLPQGPSYGDIASAYSGVGEGIGTIFGAMQKGGGLGGLSSLFKKKQSPGLDPGGELG